MTVSTDDFQFEPYLLYRANITLIEDFAEQSRFCYHIARSFVEGGEAGGAAADRSAAASADQGFERTSEVLDTNCLLLEWMFFEVLLKNTTRSLLIAHPEKLIAVDPERTLTYAELARASHTFTSTQQLRNTLITAEVERQQAGEQPVIGLLEFLRQAFRLRNDPFETEYSFKGHQSATSYREVEEIVTICSLLKQDNVAPVSTTLRERFPQLVWREQTPLVSKDYFLKAKAILNAMAASIARCIDHNWYDPA